MITVPPQAPGITRRRFFTALGGALGCCALPQNLAAREVRDYWPASREEQHQIMLWCPPKMQAWLKKLDDLTVRHFFAQIVNENIPVEKIAPMSPDLSARQLRDVRQRCTGFVRHLPERPVIRQAAADRSWDLTEFHASNGFLIRDLTQSRAEKPGVRVLEIPVNRGLDFALVIATDAINDMGVPFKLTVCDRDDPDRRIAWDHRALAQGLCSASWTSDVNGDVLLEVEFLESSVFERGLTCDWHAVIGRRARADALPPAQRGMLAAPSRPQGS